MEEIKDIVEILELVKEELKNNDENTSAILDLKDLKALKNLYDLYQETVKERDCIYNDYQDLGKENLKLQEELEQEKEKNKELNEALERSSGRVTELTVENSDLKYHIYHKQQIIDELTQNEEKLKIELAKEQEKRKDIEENLKVTVAIITKGMYPEQNEGDNDFDRQFVLIRKDKIKELIKKHEEARDLAGEQLTTTQIIADTDSLNFGRIEAHNVAIKDLEELLEGK